MNHTIQIHKGIIMLLMIVACSFQACNPKKTTSQEESSVSSLKPALTFYVSFDNGTNADFSLGDNQLYTSPIKSMDSAKVGLHKPDITIAQDEGLVGNCLKFNERSPGYIFYRSEKNMTYDTSDWSGAVSFWLSLDPEVDLKPGFCDPIQITDVSYNDASIWVDFTKTNPRDFRLGVIGDRDSWNPSPEGPDNENPIFIQQLPVVKDPPFASGKWTHVLINFDHLNTANGTAILYLDGKPVGTRSGITDPFTWEYEKSNILLGLSYIGLMDEVSIYNRVLTEQEITILFEEKEHVKGLL